MKKLDKKDFNIYSYTTYKSNPLPDVNFYPMDAEKLPEYEDYKVEIIDFSEHKFNIKTCTHDLMHNWMDDDNKFVVRGYASILSDNVTIYQNCEIINDKMLCETTTYSGEVLQRKTYNLKNRDISAPTFNKDTQKIEITEKNVFSKVANDDGLLDLSYIKDDNEPVLDLSFKLFNYGHQFVNIQDFSDGKAKCVIKKDGKFYVGNIDINIDEKAKTEGLTKDKINIDFEYDDTKVYDDYIEVDENNFLLIEGEKCALYDKNFNVIKENPYDILLRERLKQCKPNEDNELFNLRYEGYYNDIGLEELYNNNDCYYSTMRNNLLMAEKLCNEKFGEAKVKKILGAYLQSEKKEIFDPIINLAISYNLEKDLPLKEFLDSHLESYWSGYWQRENVDKTLKNDFAYGFRNICQYALGEEKVKDFLNEYIKNSYDTMDKEDFCHMMGVVLEEYSLFNMFSLETLMDAFNEENYTLKILSKEKDNVKFNFHLCHNNPLDIETIDITQAPYKYDDGFQDYCIDFKDCPEVMIISNHDLYGKKAIAILAESDCDDLEKGNYIHTEDDEYFELLTDFEYDELKFIESHYDEVYHEKVIYQEGHEDDPNYIEDAHYPIFDGMEPAKIDFLAEVNGKKRVITFCDQEFGKPYVEDIVKKKSTKTADNLLLNDADYRDIDEYLNEYYKNFNGSDEEINFLSDDDELNA